MKLTIHADGAIGKQHAGAGVIMRDEQGQVLLIANRTLPLMTCNEAEYHGLLLALELATDYRQHEITVHLDSEIVVYQINGRYAVNSRKLKPLHRDACERLRGYTRLKLQHIPRDQNRIADALAAEAAVGKQMEHRACSG